VLARCSVSMERGGHVGGTGQGSDPLTLAFNSRPQPRLTHAIRRYGKYPADINPAYPRMGDPYLLPPYPPYSLFPQH
jgi:hypothetical protein